MDSFKDYNGNIIFLSQESWLHIQENHPKVSRKIIGAVLIDPVEVRKSTQAENSELFYGAKYFNQNNKVRYIQVVIKKTSENEFLITTASIVSKMKEGVCVYKKVEVSND